MLPTVNPVEGQAWQKLTLHYLEMQATHMRELFEEDPKRFDKFHLQFEDILVDFSKNILTEETLAYLLALAEECNLKTSIAKHASAKANSSDLPDSALAVHEIKTLPQYLLNSLSKSSFFSFVLFS